MSNPTEPSVSQERLEKVAFLLLLGCVSGMFIALLWPFWGAIFWAGVIGLLFAPLFQRLHRSNRFERNLAALTTLGVSVLIGVLPVLFLATSFLREASGIYASLRTGNLDLAQHLQNIQEAFPQVTKLLSQFNIDLTPIQSQVSDIALSSSGFLAQNVLQLGQDTLSFFIALGLMLYIAFFALRDGDQIVSLVGKALPLGERREQLLFGKFTEVVRATLKGNLLVAAIQGTLGGCIFWIIGINGPLLWGVMMTLLSLIPVVGAGLIWLPVALYLLAIGEWTSGVMLIAFGAGVIGVVDNILRPILVGRDTKLPDYMVLLSTLGGFALFGLNGFILGPVIASLFLACWEIFTREFNHKETPKP
jgi:predicted PurR-regulated permease PerM